MRSLLLVFSLLLAGCATAYKINDVQIGMNKETVISTLGKPGSTSAKDGTEYLIYRFSETDDDAFIGLTTPYFVRLINGTVDSYGKQGDFDSTKTTTVRLETDEHKTVKVSGDFYSDLKKLKDLLDDGILTEDEYQAKKEILLSQ